MIKTANKRLYVCHITFKLAVIAHRGYSAKYPENTLKAIQEAYQSNRAHGIEFDVHLTEDQQVILQHDQDLVRMTVGGTGKVIDRPWRGYIDTLTTKFKDDSTLEPVALLSQVLELPLPPKFTIILDVKDDQPDLILVKVHEILKSKSNQCKNLDIYLGVWIDEFALKAREIFSDSPEIKITLITEICTETQLNSSLYDAFNLEISQIEPEIVEMAAKLGKKVFLWTCNSEAEILKAKSLNVEGILTDDPTSI